MQEADRWYAIQTRTQHERVVAQALADKGYEQFVPLFRRRRRLGAEIREIDEPLFPGYVFGKFDVLRRLPILVTPGVRKIVGCGKTPLPVEDEEIAALQAVVETGLPAQPWPLLKVGQWVRINYGAMQDLEGILVAVKKKHRFIVSVSLLERSVAVEIDDAWVTPVPNRSHPEGRLVRNLVPGVFCNEAISSSTWPR